MNEIAITFDIDWANDEVIDFTINHVLKLGIKATFFATHDSLTIKKLSTIPNFEVGIHPNFLKGSTQGNSVNSVMDTLKKQFPYAISVRSHAMVYSADIARIFSMFGMKVDSSIYLGGMQNIMPYTTKYGGGKKIARMPYYWADDGALQHLSRNFNIDAPGLKIYCFHPIHVFLNTARWSDYIAYKQEGKIPNQDVGYYGIRQCLDMIAEKQSKGKSRTLSQIAIEEGIIV